MIRYAIPLITLTAAAIPANAAEVQIAVNGPVVELSVSQSVAARPDVADISAGVTSQAPTAVEAMRQNAQAMTGVIARIKSLGINEDDIQTSGISLNAQYDYDQQRQQQVFRGYQVSNRVSVTLRDIARTGPVLDALVAAGANDLSGPNWSVADSSGAQKQAREAAMVSAHEQAMHYAQLAGYAGVRLLEINEVTEPSRPMPMMRMAVADAASSSTPVQPGQVETAVNLTVKYEMTQ